MIGINIAKIGRYYTTHTSAQKKSPRVWCGISFSISSTRWKKISYENL